MNKQVDWYRRGAMLSGMACAFLLVLAPDISQKVLPWLTFHAPWVFYWVPRVSGALYAAFLWGVHNQPDTDTQLEDQAKEEVDQVVHAIPIPPVAEQPPLIVDPVETP